MHVCSLHSPVTLLADEGLLPLSLAALDRVPGQVYVHVLHVGDKRKHMHAAHVAPTRCIFKVFW
jgi:hypothetical protein